MNNFLLFIGGVLVLLLGTAFVAPRYVDWNEYRAAFEDEASRVLGRTIRVGGNVDLRLLPTPYVRFERLRIADENGRFSAPFFKADGIKLWLAVTPMLRGTIEARHVELIKPRLRLEFDREGRGNWHGPASGMDSFGQSPSKIALQSVSMSDGTVIVVDGEGRELARASAVSGEFSADSVKGPYRFDGDLVANARKRHISFASERMNDDGSLKFRTVATSGSGAKTMRHAFNGKLVDFYGSPSVQGKLVSRLPLSRHGEAGPDAAEKPDRPASAGSGKPAVFDLKSKLTAGPRGMTLSGLSLSFEQAGRPQLLSGKISVSWDGELATKAAFSSLWLDLDRIAGGGHGTSPLQAMTQIIDRLNGFTGNSGVSRISLSIGQANLGGDIVSGIFIDLSQRAGRSTLEVLRAGLPGRASIIARGRLAGSFNNRTFDGDVQLHGGNLRQFAKWAMPAMKSVSQLSAGAFSVSSRVNAGSGWASFNELTAEFGDTLIAGAVKYNRRGQGRGKASLTLDLQAPRFDASSLLPSGLRVADLLRRLNDPWRLAASAAGGTGKFYSVASGRSAAAASDAAFDKAIKLRIGRLRVGKDRYQDVKLDVSLKNGQLLLPTLKLSSGDDLAIDLSGHVAGINKVPAGVLKGVVKAVSREAVGALARIFDLPAELRPDAGRRQAMVPLRLAGRLVFAGGTDAAGAVMSAPAPAPAKMLSPLPHDQRIDLMLSGSTAGGRVDLTAQLDGGLQGWRNRLADVTLTIRNPDSAALVKQLIPDTSGYRPATATTAAEKSIFRLNVIGVPAQRLSTLASLQAEGLSGSFNGHLQIAGMESAKTGAASSGAGKTRMATARATISSSGGKTGDAAGLALARLVGDVKINQGNGAALLAALGLDGAVARAVTTVRGSLRVDAGAEAVQLSDLQLVVNGSDITGKARIAGSGTASHELFADLTASRIAASALLVPVLRRRSGTTDASSSGGSDGGGGLVDQSAAAQPASGIWPASPFSFRSLERLNGRIKLKTAALTFGQDLRLSDAAMVVQLSKDKIVVRSLAGRALGGRFGGALQLQRGQAGAKLRGVLNIQGADLAQLFAASGQAAGTAGVTAGAAPGTAVPGTAAPKTLSRAVSGKVSLTVSFAGQALSMKAVASVLRGGGLISIGPARLHAMNPMAVNTSADAILDQKPDNPDEAMRQELAQRLASGDFELGPRRIKLTIADGALRAERFSIKTAGGTISTTNTVDLTTMMLDSEWQVKPDAQVSKVTGKTMTALPPVTLTYVGPLARIGALAPRIDVSSLVRELTVRKMERDVEKLERLRQLDEARAKQEADRRRAAELERIQQRALIEAARLRKNHRAGQKAIGQQGAGQKGAGQKGTGQRGARQPPAGQDIGVGVGRGKLQPHRRRAPLPPASSAVQSSALPPVQPANGNPARGGKTAAAVTVQPAPRPAPRSVPRPRRALKRKPKWNPFAEQL